MVKLPTLSGARLSFDDPMAEAERKHTNSLQSTALPREQNVKNEPLMSWEVLGSTKSRRQLSSNDYVTEHPSEVNKLIR